MMYQYSPKSQQDRAGTQRNRHEMVAEAARIHPALHHVLGNDANSLLQEVIGLLTQLLQNRCVNYGDRQCQEIRNIQTLQAFLDGYGIPYVVHHPPDKPHRPSLLATYGTGESPRVMLGPGSYLSYVSSSPCCS